MNVKKSIKMKSPKLSAGLWERPKNPLMKPFKHTITVKNKKYEYFITPVNKKWVFFECLGGGISQEFLAEDIPALLMELHELIISEIEYNKKYSHLLRFRISAEDKKKIQERAIKAGYSNISAFLRDLALNS
jgi:hypothetical protein